MVGPSTARIAWRNLGRNRKRTGLALAAIAIAQLALLFSDGLMHGYADSMLDAMTGPMLGHVQVHAPEWREERAMDLVLEDVAEEMGVSRGDEIALVGQGADGSLANDLFTVGGVLSSAVDLVNRMGVVMSLEAAQVTFAMTDQAHEITIRGHEAEGAAALATRVAASSRFAGTEVLPWKELAPELVTMIDMSESFGSIVLIFVFIAAAAGVANTMLMATFERRREIGMLLSLGATPGRIVRMIVTEALALGLIGVTIGSVLGGALVALTSHTGFDWAAMGGEAVGDLAYQGLNYSLEFFPRLEAADVVQGVVAVVITSILASLWPAVRCSRLEPVEAMRS